MTNELAEDGVSVQREVNYALKVLEYTRAGARMNSRVPVRLGVAGGRNYACRFRLYRGYQCQGVHGDCAAGVRGGTKTADPEWK